MSRRSWGQALGAVGLALVAAACSAPLPRTLTPPERADAQYHVRVNDETGWVASIRIPDDLPDWTDQALDGRSIATRNVDDSALMVVWDGGQCDRLTVLDVKAADAGLAIDLSTPERCSEQGSVVRGARLQFDRPIDAGTVTATNLTP